MALSVTELRNGTVFKENGEPYQVLKYTHTKMGRGLATIRVRVKNLKTGTLNEKTFNSGMKVEEAEVSKKNAQFLYSTPDSATFMDPGTYEQFEISSNVLGKAKDFLTEGATVPLVFYEGEVLGVELPPHAELKVTYAEKGAKGDSVTNVLKPVTVETGIEVFTPLFIKTGDIIKVDTRTGEYVGRVK